jgi:hypothetical protein
MNRHLVVLLAAASMAAACSPRPGSETGGAGDPDQGTATTSDTSRLMGDTTEVGHIK